MLLCLRRLLVLACALLLGIASLPLHALTPETARAIASGDNDERIEALRAALAAPSPPLAALITALLDDSARLVGERVVILRGEREGIDAATGEPVLVPENGEEIVNNNRMRRALESAGAALSLLSSDAIERRAAIARLTQEADVAQLPLIERALATETDPALKARLEALRALMQLSAEDPRARLQAIASLETRADPQIRSLLQARLAPDAEGDPAVRKALETALRSVESRLAWGEWLGVLFTGVSLGSILLLAALGLAITYGLMGVINMAHGELIMIGAYTTYLVQGAFRMWVPAAFDFYVIAAIPAAFLVSALVGAAMERSVIRWLYGRPLETLLATWGISLILMQAVRSLFGAQNVPVENPSWLSGGVQVLGNLTLPYNRIAIIVFAALVVLAVVLVVQRTRLGLFVRGVTQNRPIAAAMGVNTARIDTLAFALGSGIAGLAGCALSQVGNVGPDLGQAYIVDSFMVVVLGGVGQIAGTVYAALGLGAVNKLLEGWTGAVLAKIIVLVFIVLFIQRRPQGIFAMRGRSADA